MSFLKDTDIFMGQHPSLVYEISRTLFLKPKQAHETLADHVKMQVLMWEICGALFPVIPQTTLRHAVRSDSLRTIV